MHVEMQSWKTNLAFRLERRYDGSLLHGRQKRMRRKWREVDGSHYS